MHAEEARKLVEVANNASIELILKNILWRAEKGYTSLDHHTTSIPFYNSIKEQLTELGYKVSEARVYGFHNVKVYFTIRWEVQIDLEAPEEDGGTVRVNQHNIPYWAFTRKEKELIDSLIYFFDEEEVVVEKINGRTYLHIENGKLEFTHPVFNLLPPNSLITIERISEFMKEQGDLK